MAKTRGACVIDLATFVLQDPWDEIAQTFQVPGIDVQRPLTVASAQRALRNMAGVPTSSLDRLVRRWELDSHAEACLQSARRRGAAGVVALAAPQAIAEALSNRLGADASAALTPEIVLGRFTGNLVQPSWAGPCGQAVCLDQVARVAQAEYGRPVDIVSRGPGCTCNRALVSPTKYLLDEPMQAVA